MKSEEMRAAGQRPAKAVSDVRFVGGVNGRYTLESRRTAIGGRAQVFACRAKSISLREALLAAPVSGTVGEGLTVHFDQIGILKGQVSKVLADGFVMSIAASEARLAKLAATIGWLKRRTMHSVVDRREHRRIQPRNPRSVILFPDNSTLGCFIIDYSLSGVAVSADVTPAIGAPIAVGTLVGQVIRLLDRGFAVRFAGLQESEGLEDRLGIHPGERNAVLARLSAFAAAGGLVPAQ